MSFLNRVTPSDLCIISIYLIKSIHVLTVQNLLFVVLPKILGTPMELWPLPVEDGGWGVELVVLGYETEDLGMDR